MNQNIAETEQILKESGSWLQYLDADELRKIRRKYWTFVVFADDDEYNMASDMDRHKFRKDIVDGLQAAVVPALVSPIHDKDLKSDGSGELAKPHVHVIVFFEQPQRYMLVLKLLQYKCGFEKVKYIEIVANVRALMRYLIHLDNPEKVQYDPSDVIEVCGAKFVVEDETASEFVVNMIFNNNVTTMSHLLMKLEANPSAKKWVMCNNSFVSTLLKEQRHWVFGQADVIDEVVKTV